MNQISLESVLKHPKMYLKLQNFMGADRLRKKCIEIIDPQPSDSILDIGCGPGQIFDFMPKIKKYYGFDTEKRYIDYASKKYLNLGEFFNCEFDEKFLNSTKIDSIDKVFLMGILHHIPNKVAIDLLKLLCRVLKPTGSVISLDPCYTPNQSIISKFIAKNDRGKFVRTESEYLSLFKNIFSEIDGKIFHNTCRIPSTEIIFL